MTMLQIEPLNLEENSGLFKSNNLWDLEEIQLKEIYGGRFRKPTALELEVMVGLRNTPPSRNLAGAVVDGMSTAVNIGVGAPGSSNNIGNQVNA